MPEFSPEVTAALSEIEDAITRNLDVLCKGLPGVEETTVMLSEWGVVFYVTDVNDPTAGWADARCAPTMPYHHWLGLLRQVTIQEESEDGGEDE